MHTKPMAEKEGTFTPAGPEVYKCRKCGERRAQCEIWESSCGGYSDEKYTCNECGYAWWIEGPDA